MRVPTGRVQLAGPFDIDLLAALHSQCFSPAEAEAWDLPAIAALLDQPGVFAFFAVTEATVTEDVTPSGLIIARTAGGESEILTLGILSTCRRGGLGLLLIEAAVSHAVRDGADAMFLEVAADNEPARALYRRARFHRIGKRARYYRRDTGRVDALLLRRDLPSSVQSPRG